MKVSDWMPQAAARKPKTVRAAGTYRAARREAAKAAYRAAKRRKA